MINTVKPAFGIPYFAFGVRKNFLENKVLEHFELKYFANIRNSFSPFGGMGVLFQDFSNLSGTYCTATFADREFQTLFHRDGLDQFYVQVGVIARHYHLSTSW